VGVHEAKTRLSELLRAVAGGQEVDILRSGHPVARIIAFPVSSRRPLGLDEGQVRIAPDFDAPLPDEAVDTFYQ